MPSESRRVSRDTISSGSESHIRAPIQTAPSPRRTLTSVSSFAGSPSIGSFAVNPVKTFAISQSGSSIRPSISIGPSFRVASRASFEKSSASLSDFLSDSASAGVIRPNDWGSGISCVSDSCGTRTAKAITTKRGDLEHPLARNIYLSTTQRSVAEWSGIGALESRARSI